MVVCRAPHALCTVGKPCIICVVLEFLRFAQSFLMVVVFSCLGGGSATFPRSGIGIISAPDLGIFKYFVERNPRTVKLASHNYGLSSSCRCCHSISIP